jgi:hypothetical protein
MNYFGTNFEKQKTRLGGHENKTKSKTHPLFFFRLLLEIIIKK